MLSLKLNHMSCWFNLWFFLVQVSGGRELGDGVIREAAHRGRAEGQEEVERGEQHQARTTLLQVRAEAHLSATSNLFCRLELPVVVKSIVKQQHFSCGAIF